MQTVVVYKEGDTYTADLTSYIDSEISISSPIDWEFARGNDNGEVISSGINFNPDTYMLTFTEEALEDISSTDFADLQVQLLVPASLNSVDISISIDDKEGVSNYSSGDYSFRPFQIINLDLINSEYLDNINESDIIISNNQGNIYSFNYDNKRGSITLEELPINISNLNISISKTNRLKFSIQSKTVSQISNWLTLPDNYNISKFTKGKVFYDYCWVNFASGSDVTSNETYKQQYTSVGDIGSIKPGYYDSRGILGVISIPTTFYGLKNFNLSGVCVDGVTRAKSSDKYNRYLYAYCYHISRPRVQYNGKAKVQWKVEDKSSDGTYTYIVLSFIQYDSYLASTPQAVGGYIGIKVKSPNPPDSTNMTLQKKVLYQGDEVWGDVSITDIDPEAYAVFKVDYFEGIHSIPSFNQNPTRTWYFRTRKTSEATEVWPAGSVSFNVSAHHAEGYTSAEHYKNGARIYYPDGITRVTEVAVYPQNKYRVLNNYPIYFESKMINGKTETDWMQDSLNKYYVVSQGNQPIPTYSDVEQNLIDFYNYPMIDETNVVIFKEDQDGNEVTGVTFKGEFFLNKTLDQVKKYEPIYEEYESLVETYLKSMSRDDAEKKATEEVNLPTPTYTWNYQQEKNSFSDMYQHGFKYWVNLNRGACFINTEDGSISSDDYAYAFPSVIGYPIGVLRLKETSAPKGYKLAPDYLYVVFTNSNGNLSAKWAEDTLNLEYIENIGLEPVAENLVGVRNGIKIVLENRMKGKLKLIKQGTV